MTPDEYRTLLDWFANTVTGRSSETIAFALAGVTQRRDPASTRYPRDISDVERCLDLIERMGWREAFLTEFAKPEYGKVWNELVHDWPAVERLAGEKDARGVFRLIERAREAAFH